MFAPTRNSRQETTYSAGNAYLCALEFAESAKDISVRNVCQAPAFLRRQPEPEIDDINQKLSLEPRIQTHLPRELPHPQVGIDEATTTAVEDNRVGVISRMYKSI